MRGQYLFRRISCVASMLLCCRSARADPPAPNIRRRFHRQRRDRRQYSLGFGSVDRLTELRIPVSRKSHLARCRAFRSSPATSALSRRRKTPPRATSSSPTNASCSRSPAANSCSRSIPRSSCRSATELPARNLTRAPASICFFKRASESLPDAVRMLRPLGVEGDFGWESKVTGARDDLISTDLELEYSLQYLDENVAAISVPRAFRELTPNLDFDYGQYLSAHRNSSAPNFSLTPAIAWMNATVRDELRRPGRASITPRRHAALSPSSGYSASRTINSCPRSDGRPSNDRRPQYGQAPI